MALARAIELASELGAKIRHAILEHGCDGHVGRAVIRLLTGVLQGQTVSAEALLARERAKRHGRPGVVEPAVLGQVRSRT